MVTTTYPPSWYLDPMRRHELRYWDGFRWTENVSDAGVPGVDTIFEDTTKPSRYVPPAPPPATTVARDGLGQGGTAADPGDLAQRFPEAGITCRDMDVIYDNRSSKALGCAGTQGQIVTITTYGSRPSPASWVRDWCATVDEPRQGAYVAGDGFIIEVHEGPYPADLLGQPPTALEGATRLAGVLGGTAATYSCP